MTLLTNLGVKGILCIFRLALEGKTGKEIPESSRLEFQEKILANNFTLSDAEYNTSRSLNRGGITDLPLLRTLLAIYQKSRESSFWEVISICKFCSFKNPFAMITGLSDFSFRFWRFTLLLQMKKGVSMNCSSHTSSWKSWRLVWLDLILSMRHTYINSNWTHSQNSLAVAEAPSLKISFHGTSLKWSKRLSQPVQE